MKQKTKVINPEFTNSFVQFEPSLDDMVVNDYNEFAPIYDEIMGADFAEIIYKKYVGIIKDIFQDKEIYCLDLACGSAAFIRKLSNSKIASKIAHCVGLDISNLQIWYAEKKNEKEEHSVSLQVRDVLKGNLPFGYDVVTMNLDALNHIRDPIDWHYLFSKIHGIIKPCGVFLFDINSQDRIINDWNCPEVIVKPNMTYVQIGSKVFQDGDFVGRRLLMQVFRGTSPHIQRYSVLVEQIAPSKEKLFEMLDYAGFKKKKEILFSEKEKADHIFMKNRIFVAAYK